MIPYGRQDVQDADIEAVISVLRSDFLTQGERVPEFERAVAKYCGAPFAVAVNSATSALHLACLALGLGEGDWLWTSPISFLASANCARYCGASVDFVDIDPKTFNMSTVALSEKLSRAEREHRLPKIIVPVHMAGQSCDMAEIKRLADQYGIFIIEDASHAIGGEYLNQKIGHCQYSDITVFSFHPVKIITTAEGGVALTRQKQLAEKMALLRSHGMTRDASNMHKTPDGAWYYEQIDLGFNYRMTELQAALGRSQLTRLDEYVERRHEIAKNYFDALFDLPIQLPEQDPKTRSAFHLFIIQSSERKALFDHLKAAGIGVNVHYIPIYRQPYYANGRVDVSEFPHAEQYYHGAISLPIFPKMTAGTQQYVIETLKNYFESCS